MKKRKFLIIVFIIGLILFCIVFNVNKNRKNKIVNEVVKDGENKREVSNIIFDSNTGRYVIYDKNTGKEIAVGDSESDLIYYEYDPDYDPKFPEQFYQNEY